MAYELTGTIKKIFPRQDFPSGFYKQEFVVTTNERFPQDVKLDCAKEKVEMLENLQEGDAVKVSFDIRGREYNDRFYVDLAAWKIEPAGEGDTAPAPKAAARPAPSRPAPARKPAGPASGPDDDLPF